MIIFEFWFIVFAVIFIAAGILASEIENFAIGTGTFIIGLVILQWMFNIPIWQSIVDNPLSIILYLTLYTIAGAVYTLLWRWPEFIRENATYISDEYKSYKKHHPEGTNSDFLGSSYYKFKAGRHTHRFATWILTWPFSLTWELARKPTKYFYNAIYALLGDAFDRVGRSVTNRIINK